MSKVDAIGLDGGASRDAQAQNEAEALRGAVAVQGRERAVAAQAQARLAAAKKQIKALEWSAEVRRLLGPLQFLRCVDMAWSFMQPCHGCMFGVCKPPALGGATTPIVRCASRAGLVRGTDRHCHLPCQWYTNIVSISRC